MKYFFLLVLVVGLSGCSSEEPGLGGLTVSYAETQCSDPWLKPGNTSASGWPNDKLRAQAIINYLFDNKVSSASNVRFIEITPIYNGGSNLEPTTGLSICQACTCSSGRRIDVTISEIDWERAKKLGFKRQ